MVPVVIFIRAFYTFIGGLFIAVAIVQEDPWFLKAVEHFISKRFSATFDCAMQCQVKSLNLFTLSLHLENIHVCHREEGSSPWYWSCKKCFIQAYWLSYLFTKKFATTVQAKQFVMQSHVINTTLAIAPHLKKILFDPAVLPIDLQRVRVHNGTFAINNTAHAFDAQLQWHADIALMSQRSKIACSLTHASITCHDNCLLETLKGAFTAFSRKLGAAIDMQASSNMQALLPWVLENNGQVECSAHVRNNAGRFELHNEDHAFNVEITPINECLMTQVSGNFPLQHVLRALGYSFANDCKGIIDMTCSVDLYDPLTSCKGMLKLYDIGYKDYTVQEVEAVWNAYQEQVHGSLTCCVTPTMQLQGNAHYTFCDNNVEVMITNATPCSYGNFFVAPHNFLLTGSIRDWYSLEGSLSCTILDKDSHDPVIKTTTAVSGTIDNALVHGSYNDDFFDASIYCKRPYALSVTCFTDHEELAQAHYEHETCTIFLKNPLLQRCIRYYTGHNFIGNGDLVVTLKEAALTKGTFAGTCDLRDGMIRLSPLYNIIKELHTDFMIDCYNRSLRINCLNIALHRGEIATHDAKLFFDENFKCVTAFVPLSLQSCFLSWHKDVFAMLSGNGTLSYTQNDMMIQGECTIERSHIKGNILRGEIGNQGVPPITSFLQNCGLSVHVASQRPIEVQTSFLEASASLDCAITGTLATPNVGGSLEISHGMLSFPYKPLYITRSTLYFLPDELDNPSIVLHAKNTIKQFEITLTITGSLKKPVITFSSCPSLTEEQIITLLFTGSEDAALSAVLQTMIVQNIQNLVLGPADQTRPLQKYLKNLLKPFKNIRVIPSFSDESGRAGLKAAVEVEVNDRLRGSIQKNFSLPEDIFVEVDYALSDEVTIKGIRNERGNMGAEMELRFKL